MQAGRVGSGVVFVLVFAYVALGSVLPPECGVMDPPMVPVMTNSGFTLRQVNVLFRHGDRIMWGDDPCWPGDQGTYDCGLTHTSIPSQERNQTELTTGFLFRKNYMEGRNYYPGNCMTGQLTNKGYDQEHNTGAMYRQVYVDTYGLLPSMFDPSTTYMRSDSEDRCVQSLEALFSGLYGPESHSAWSVYNIDTMDTAYDDIAPNSQLCPLFGEYLDEYKTTPEYQAHYTKFTEPLYQALSDALGFPVDSSTFSHVHDCLTVHKCRQQPIPATITQELFSAVNAEFSYGYWMEYNYPSREENAQAGIGFLLQEMVEKMDNMVTANSTYKLTLWSGHDTSVVPMLNALGLWRGAWACYASQLVFELWEEDASGEFYIRIIYNGEVLSGNLAVSGCDGTTGLCPYSGFRSLAEALFPVPGACGPLEDVDTFWAARAARTGSYTKYGYHLVH